MATSAGWQEERARAAAEEQPAFGRANGRGERRGKDALTEFRVLRRFGDFATLVEARPITGRTHQIRVQPSTPGMPSPAT